MGDQVIHVGRVAAQGPQGERGPAGPSYIIGVYESATSYDASNCKDYCERANTVSWNNNDIKNGNTAWANNIGRKILLIIHCTNGDDYISFQTIASKATLRPDNNYWISKKGKDGIVGSNGAPGKNGITPHIGNNGNWYIGDSDTGTHAQGPQGPGGLTTTNASTLQGSTKQNIIDSARSGYASQTWVDDSFIRHGENMIFNFDSNAASKGIYWNAPGDSTAIYTQWTPADDINLIMKLRDNDTDSIKMIWNTWDNPVDTCVFKANLLEGVITSKLTTNTSLNFQNLWRVDADTNKWKLHWNANGKKWEEGLAYKPGTLVVHCESTNDTHSPTIDSGNAKVRLTSGDGQDVALVHNSYNAHYDRAGAGIQVIGQIPTEEIWFEAPKLYEANAHVATEAWSNNQYLKLTGGTINGNITAHSLIPKDDNSYDLGNASHYFKNSFIVDAHFWNHLCIGTNLSSTDNNRAELDVVSRGDVPCDIWFGTNKIRQWSIACKPPKEGGYLGFYNNGYRLKIMPNGEVTSGGITVNSKVSDLQALIALVSNNHESSIKYQGTNKAWTVGTGCGGQVNDFAFWNGERVCSYLSPDGITHGAGYAVSGISGANNYLLTADGKTINKSTFKGDKGDTGSIRVTDIRNANSLGTDSNGTVIAKPAPITNKFIYAYSGHEWGAYTLPSDVKLAIITLANGYGDNTFYANGNQKPSGTHQLENKDVIIMFRFWSTVYWKVIGKNDIVLGNTISFWNSDYYEDDSSDISVIEFR